MTDCLWFVPELVMLLEWWSGTECVIHTDPRAYPKYGKENAIVVLNHKFEIDFLCGWSLAERFGVLGVSGIPGSAALGSLLSVLHDLQAPHQPWGKGLTNCFSFLLGIRVPSACEQGSCLFSR